uniref:Uncharacterized protein n=1 Tax=Leersia perrieri TaxID=77586 RepID=A0A0D9WED3_9ORYZ
MARRRFRASPPSIRRLRRSLLKISGSPASGEASPVSLSEDLPRRRSFIWRLGTKDGACLARGPVSARLFFGDRDRSRSRSPPRGERRRPSGWDVPPPQEAAPLRRPSSRPAMERRRKGGGGRRHGTSPVRERSRSPRVRLLHAEEDTTHQAAQVSSTFLLPDPAAALAFLDVFPQNENSPDPMIDEFASQQNNSCMQVMASQVAQV